MELQLQIILKGTDTWCLWPSFVLCWLFDEHQTFPLCQLASTSFPRCLTLFFRSPLPARHFDLKVFLCLCYLQLCSKANHLNFLPVPLPVSGQHHQIKNSCESPCLRYKFLAGCASVRRWSHPDPDTLAGPLRSWLSCFGVALGVLGRLLSYRPRGCCAKVLLLTFEVAATSRKSPTFQILSFLSPTETITTSSGDRGLSAGRTSAAITVFASSLDIAYKH